MRQHLPGASRLPFVAVLTYQGKWVDGFSGYKDMPQFVTFLDGVEKSPVLQATPEVRSQLAKHAEAAKVAAEKSKWPDVLKSVRAADGLFGACPERQDLRLAEQQARGWLTAQFDAVTAAAVGGEKLTKARKTLREMKRKFAGHPEADLAATGIKALAKLTRIRAAESSGRAKASLRTDAAAEFEGTRWAALFVVPTAEDAAQPGK